MTCLESWGSENMTKEEYEYIISSLRAKIKKGCLNNRDGGYNTGITTAMSKIKEVYERSTRYEEGAE
jgi:hypothetical protein